MSTLFAPAHSAFEESPEVLEASARALAGERLEEEALAGRKHLARLREEAVRLGLLAGVGLERRALEGLVGKLSPEEMAALSKAWERQAEGRYPLKTQLRYEEQTRPLQGQDGAFLI